jgi:hypothetical protein
MNLHNFYIQKIKKNVLKFLIKLPKLIIQNQLNHMNYKLIFKIKKIIVEYILYGI